MNIFYFSGHSHRNPYEKWTDIKNRNENSVAFYPRIYFLLRIVGSTYVQNIPVFWFDIRTQNSIAFDRDISFAVDFPRPMMLKTYLILL